MRGASKHRQIQDKDTLFFPGVAGNRKTTNPPKMSRAATINMGKYGLLDTSSPNITVPIMDPIRPTPVSKPNAVDLQLEKNILKY